MPKLSINEKELQELLQRLRAAGKKHHEDLDGVAVLHAAAAIHEKFIKSGLLVKMLKALDHVGLLPQPQNVEGWEVGFDICTSPQGIAALCYALNLMAEEVVPILNEALGDMGPENLKQEEIN